MKRLHYILGLILVNVFWLGAFLASPASAAPPVCYKLQGPIQQDPQTVAVDCSSIRAHIVAATGRGPEDDKCYVRTQFGVQSYALDSFICRNYAAVVQGPDALDAFQQRNEDRRAAQSLTNPNREAIANCNASQRCINRNPIVILAKLVINILSALVGIVVIAVIIIAGIQYSSSGGNPQQAAESKKRIVNAMIALIAYFMLFVVLQWLIPGGLT